MSALLCPVLKWSCGPTEGEINTRECTIACPGNSESIKIENDCYCKLQTIRDAVEGGEHRREE